MASFVVIATFKVLLTNSGWSGTSTHYDAHLTNSFLSCPAPIGIRHYFGDFTFRSISCVPFIEVKSNEYGANWLFSLEEDKLPCRHIGRPL
jgi:hypothetical protein